MGENKTKVTTNANDTLNVLYKDTEHNYNVDKGKVAKVNDLNDYNIVIVIIIIHYGMEIQIYQKLKF